MKIILGTMVAVDDDGSSFNLDTDHEVDVPLPPQSWLLSGGPVIAPLLLGCFLLPDCYMCHFLQLPCWVSSFFSILLSYSFFQSFLNLRFQNCEGPALGTPESLLQLPNVVLPSPIELFWPFKNINITSFHFMTLTQPDNQTITKKSKE